MATIFYSLAGEGRGHAARAHTIVERLKARHEIVLFTFDEAYEFLAPLYAGGNDAVRVERIPGLRFHYWRRRLNLPRTVAGGIDYYCRTLPRLTSEMERRIRQERPDLVLVDFEPSLPRAAKRCGVPFVCLDHQRFLVAYDLSCLPARLRRYARLMSWVVRAYHTGEQATIVSSFFAPPLKPGYEQVVQVGPLIRQEVLAAEISIGDYLLAYLRSHTPRRVVDVLARCGQEVRVYGLGERPPEGRLRFLAVDPAGFARDMAGCRAMIAAAGNQLLGEALFLGKPFLALPEANHHEQLINAHFLKTLGGGDGVPLQKLTLDHIRRFLSRLEEFAAYRHHPWWKSDGTDAAVQAVERQLAAAAATRPASDSQSPSPCEHVT